MCERAGKIIAWTLCFMPQSNIRPSYFFNHDAYFLDLCAQNNPLILLIILFNITSPEFWGSKLYKKTIKKISVKFWEDLLYFSSLCKFLSLPQISDYHHLKSRMYNFGTRYWTKISVFKDFCIVDISAHYKI